MFETEMDTTGRKVNGFISVKSKPYLLGYYLNNYQYIPLDTAVLSNGVAIDTSVDGQALIEINIDQTRKAGDGTPLLVGNSEKKEELEAQVMNYREFIAHNRFSVIRKGLVVRINYRLENQRTGVPIKTVTEDFKIFDSGFYSYSAGVNAADPAVVVNFSDSIIASVNQFTHGVDPIVIRINSVHLYYEVLSPLFEAPRRRDVSLMTFGYPLLQPPCGCRSNHIDDPRFRGFNNLYRFGTDNNDIFLNQTEIDTSKRVELLECGAFYLNKSFVVVPTQRILFKVSVWKNDLTVVSNTYRIANILGIYAFDTFGQANGSFANSVINEFNEQRIDDQYRDQVIKSLYNQIAELKAQMTPMQYITSKPKPVPPEQFKPIKKCTCDCCSGKCHNHQVPPPPPEHHHCSHECDCCDDCNCYSSYYEPLPVRYNHPHKHPHKMFIEDIEQIVDQTWTNIS